MQFLQHSQGISGMSRQNQVADNGSPSDIAILHELTGASLANHLGNGGTGLLRIILCMGKSSGKLFIRIFHIRQINIHISFQQPKGFHIFISAGIIHYRQHQSLSSGDFQGGNNLRYIVSTCHQIQIRRPLLLQLQKNICKPLHRNLFSAVPNGNIPVLTKAAAQSAA